MEHNNLDACIEEWETLSNEYRALEKLHKDYCQKLDELTNLQQKCEKGIAHQRYRIGIIKQSLKTIDHGGDCDNKERNDLLQTDLIRRKAQLHEMENILPKQSGNYLKIILGNINVSILDKNEKHRYKDEYEKFKLVMSLIAFALSCINMLTNIRILDIIHMFLLVWYYCTLTIRESILKVNGSRIKGWWRAHHFITTVLAGVLLIWPTSDTYYAFRRQFMAFNVYISFVQYLQFMYQRGCLYRLKALGERHNMDITIEGFHSWMWRGLGFIIPFLFLGYLWELYNAYTLYLLSFTENAEWHVGALSGLFAILFLGNTITTISIIPQKFGERTNFKYRFTRLDKYIWTHKKRRVSFRNPESPERRTEAARAASFSKKLPSELDIQEAVPISVTKVDKENATSSASEGEIEIINPISGAGLGSSEILHTEEKKVVTEEDNEGSTEVTHRGPAEQIIPETQDQQHETNEDKKDI